MKKIIAVFLAISLLGTVVGCSGKSNQNAAPTVNGTQQTAPSGQQPTQTTATDPSGSVLPTTPEGTGTTNPTVPPLLDPEKMIAVSMHTETEQTKAANGTLLFDYSFQSLRLVLNNPGVSQKISVNFMNRNDGTRSAAQNTAASANSAYNNAPSSAWIPYLYHLTYNPSRIDSKVLSLSGIKEIYDGGPHPNRSGISASYDMRTGDVLTLASIMASNAKMDDFCNLVLEELAKRTENDLYPSYPQEVKRRFTSDAIHDEDWYFTKTGLCFFFDPYEIAPYASGIITVEIPYAKLQNLLYYEYLPYQLANVTGSAVITGFTPTVANNFSHIAELILDASGKMYMIYAEGTIQNIQILCNSATGTNVLLAANSLTAGEAIMLQAGDSTLQKLELRYESNGKTVSMMIK